MTERSNRSSSLGERLVAARSRRFVGRGDEIARFRAAAETPAGEDPPFSLLHVFGPGGVGKTSLLDAFADVARAGGRTPLILDGRSVEPTPDGVLDALRRALALGPGEDPLAHLASSAGRPVLMIDTYEALDALDPWVRDVLLPRLPGDALAVLAGRRPPSPAWRSDSGWQTALRPLPLRNLSPSESRAYLAGRSVPAHQHPAVLSFTHGHPLALSLVADLLEQRSGGGAEPLPFTPDDAPDLVRTLLERFADDAPGPQYRAALEVCAVVRLTTEPLLAEMLGGDVEPGRAGELFEWLRGLSFIESGRRGLFPHDLARDALVADLRWRSPERLSERHRRARAYYSARLKQTHGEEQQRLLADYIYLHRDNAVVRSAFAWDADSGSGLFADAFRPADRPALLAMTARHEGDASAALLDRWLDRQPRGAIVFRRGGGAAGDEPVGFVASITLTDASPADRDADPAARGAWEHLERGPAPLRPGEAAVYFRFWMARDTYQEVSPVQSLILVSCVRQCLTVPGLAYTFFASSEPDLWEPVFEYAEMRRVPSAEFAVGDRRWGVFGNDWRALSAVEWLALLADKETAAGYSAAPPRREPLVVLSQPEFASAVRAALRDWARPDALRTSPLLRSRAVAGHAGTGGDRLEALRSLIREAAESLQATPRAAKAYRAVYHTFLQPEPTQEQAADLLDLPFSTYRRHLTTGVAQIVDRLWRQEIGVSES